MTIAKLGPIRKGTSRGGSISPICAPTGVYGEWQPPTVNTAKPNARSKTRRGPPLEHDASDLSATMIAIPPIATAIGGRMFAVAERVSRKTIHPSTAGQ